MPVKDNDIEDGDKFYAILIYQNDDGMTVPYCEMSSRVDEGGTSQANYLNCLKHNKITDILNGEFTIV